MLAELSLASLKVWTDVVEPSLVQGDIGYYTTTGTPTLYQLDFSYNLGQALVFDVLWALLALLVAYMTWQNLQTAVIPDQLGHVPPGHDIVPHLCSCCEDMNACCMGFWFPCILRAKTAHQAKIPAWSFWRVVLTIAVGGILPYGLSWLVVSGVCLVLRVELRKRANLPPNLCCDCVQSFCCWWLTTCQEAEYVKRALAAGPGPQAVGAAVQIVAYPAAPGAYPMATYPNQTAVTVRPQ